MSAAVFERRLLTRRFAFSPTTSRSLVKNRDFTLSQLLSPSPLHTNGTDLTRKRLMWTVILGTSLTDVSGGQSE